MVHTQHRKAATRDSTELRPRAYREKDDIVNASDLTTRNSSSTPAQYWAASRWSLSNASWTRRYVHWITQQRDSAGAGKRPAIQSCTGVERDRRLSHNSSSEGRRSSQRRRATDLPEHVVVVGAVGQNDLAVGIRRG